jgi:hypothetical protein
MLLAYALLACGGPDDTDISVVDLRLDPADIPSPPAGGDQWEGPDVIVQPYSEVQYCLFGTYTGPDVGLTYFESFQGAGAHHLILLGTSATTQVHPDGELIDCTKTSDIPMTDFEPLINAEPTGAGSSKIELPEGMAVKLRSGQRYVVQAHYVNTSDETRRYLDLMNVGLVDPETVTTWAAAFALTDVDLSLPAGQSTTVTFDCDPETSYNLLYVTGHMHEWGTSFALDAVTGDATDELFTIPAWDPQYRDLPPIAKWGEGEMVWSPGTQLRTTCTWFNDTEEELDFPSEMCATYGMLYPSVTPVVCVP